MEAKDIKMMDQHAGHETAVAGFETTKLKNTNTLYSSNVGIVMR